MNPYIRPSLTATREQIPDPAIEVEAWINDLEVLLAAWEPEPTPEDCYDLLALWARLRRTRSELVAQLGGQDVVATAEQLMRQHGVPLARAALAVPNPAAWQKQTRELEASYEELLDPSERCSLAERLLADLDDADLVLYAARKLGVDDLQLTDQLSECNDWLAAHADLFLAASVYVQAVGMSLRPDLAEEDYDLAATTLKYEWILDAAEEAEAELAGAGLRPFPIAGIRQWLRQYRPATPVEVIPAKDQTRSPLGVLDRYRRALEAPSLLAARPQSAESVDLVRWDAPDRRWVAYLEIPHAERPPEDWTLRIYTVGGDHSEFWAGQPVRLDGVEAVLDSQGRAFFSRRDLERAVRHDLRLEVGVDRSVWELSAD